MIKIEHEHHTEMIFNHVKEYYGNSKYVEYRKLWNERPVKREPGDFPVNLDVSVTNACNLECTMCKRTNVLNNKNLREKNELIDSEIRYLDVDVFKKVIDEGVENGLKAVHLTGHDGEPTLHDRFPEMIEYSRKKGIIDVFANTNATLLHKDDRIDRILKAQPHRIMFSVDSPYKETYEKIRINAKYDVVLNNIKNFIKRKKELGSLFPIVKVQMVVMEQNKGEIDEFKRLFRDKLGVDILGFTEFVNFHGIIEDKRKKISPATSGVLDSRYVCVPLYRRFILDHSNLVYACLASRYHLLGDAGISSVKEMWNGPYLQELRENHLEVGSGKTQGCETCGMQWTSKGIIIPDVRADIVKKDYMPIKNVQS